MAKDSASGTSLTNAPGHQGGQNTGGIVPGHRVLFCNNMSISVDYEQVYLVMKSYGKIECMRLALDKSKTSFECYVIFEDEISAKKAKEHYHNHAVNNCILKTRIFHIDNFIKDPLDFTPQNTLEPKEIERKLSIP